MKKSTKIIIAIVVIIAIAASIIVAVIMNAKPKEEKKESSLGPINSAKELADLVGKIYEGQDNLYPTLETRIIDTGDSSVQSLTGLENGGALEYLVVSEPMMSSQAYSLVLAKVKDGEDANKIAKEMFDGVNPRKWLCVSAEKIYATSSGDIVFLVMSEEKIAKPVYDKFKEMAVNVGDEYTETVSESLPSTEPTFELPTT